LEAIASLFIDRAAAVALDAANDDDNVEGFVLLVCDCCCLSIAEPRTPANVRGADIDDGTVRDEAEETVRDEDVDDDEVVMVVVDEFGVALIVWPIVAR